MENIDNFGTASMAGLVGKASGSNHDAERKMIIFLF
jgi:hypothetical protein